MPSPLRSAGVLHEYCSAIVPAAFSMPTVASPPWPGEAVMSPVYAYVMSPFSDTIASNEKRWSAWSKTNTLRHSMMYWRLGAVPVVLVHTDADASTIRSSQNGYRAALGFVVLGIGPLIQSLAVGTPNETKPSVSMYTELALCPYSLIGNGVVTWM